LQRSFPSRVIEPRRAGKKESTMNGDIGGHGANTEGLPSQRGNLDNNYALGVPRRILVTEKELTKEDWQQQENPDPRGASKKKSGRQGQIDILVAVNSFLGRGGREGTLRSSKKSHGENGGLKARHLF